MQLHNLKVEKKKASKRIGRGGSHGAYSTRGMKGQKARSGGKSKSGRAVLGRASQMKRLPMLRGFRSAYAKKFAINLNMLDKCFNDGDIVNKISLLEKGLLPKTVKSAIKILGIGELTKKISIEGFSVSKSAKEKIEKAGGKIL